MSEHDQEGGIKVVDKRRFTSSGEVRQDAPEDAPRPAPPPQSRPAPQKQGAPAPQKEAGIDFMSFMASLATNALAAMGLLPEAKARGLPVNLDLAREYIEIIAMLQVKTAGNVTREEEHSLQRLLTDLRLQFVELSKRRK